MGFSLIGAASGASANTLSASTSPTLSSIGADLSIIFVCGLKNANFVVTQGADTLTPLTQYDAGAGNDTCRIYYCVNPVQVSSGFTVSVSGAGGIANYPGIALLLFSGVNTSDPFGTENGHAQTSGTTDQPGPMTPPENNCLAVCGVGSAYDNAGLSIDSGFTIPSNGSAGFIAANGFGVGLAYFEQTTGAASLNPQWSGTGSPDFRATSIASFKSAGGGGSSSVVPVFINQYRQRSN